MARTSKGRQRMLPIISLDVIQNELAEQSPIAEQKETARIAAGRIALGSPTRARTWDLRINSPSLSWDRILNQALATHAKFQE